jgi:hypothetical protein
MKQIPSALLPLALLIATSSSAAPAPTSTNPSPVNLTVSGTDAELLHLERTKCDHFFGTAAEKRAVLRMFASDFVSVGYGATGPTRDGVEALAERTKTFPSVTHGTYIMSEPKVIRLGRDCAIVSYVLAGPWGDREWRAFLSSTWVKRGGEWKTVFYQATGISPPPVMMTAAR